MKEMFNCTKCGNSFQADINNDIICCPNCGNMNFPETKLRTGFQLNGFELVRKIGSGAMGTVWLAKQTSMQRNVAIKILSPSVCSRKGFIDRFQGEIKNSAKLDHPNIAQAFDAGYRSGFYYLVSAFIDGKNLEEKLNDSGKIPEEEALQIAIGVAEALSYAWSEFNMLHRDIKPSNIIIDKKSTPKLMDMGLSKCINEDPSLTYDGEVVGTPYYMSPEQAKGKTNLDLRSDIYSLGATVYHLVTGQLPFDGKSSVGILTKHITEPLIPPKSKNNSISTETNNLIMAMMAKTPENRIQSWYEIIGELKNILDKLQTAKVNNKLKLKKQNDTDLYFNKNNSIHQENSPYEEQLKLQEQEIIKQKKTKKSLFNIKLSAAKSKLILHIFYGLIFLFFAFLIIHFIYSKFFLEISGMKANVFNLYHFIEIKFNEAFSFLYGSIQLYFFNNKFNNLQTNITLNYLTWEVIAIILLLLSAFWAASKAQQNQKNCLLHFIGGLLVPYIYPLFIYRIDGYGIKQDNSGKEIPEKKIKTYFKKTADKYNEINSCFEFELYDDSKIYAEHVVEVKNNMLVLQIYTETGDSKIQRIPYSRIKNYTKL